MTHINADIYEDKTDLQNLIDDLINLKRNISSISDAETIDESISVIEQLLEEIE